MQITSQLVSHYETGLVLDVIADGLPIRAYVAVSEPDIEVVTQFVPPEQFENGSNLHVAAIASSEEAEALIEDVLFNMEADDAVALLCVDEQAWQAALIALGYEPEASSLK